MITQSEVRKLFTYNKKTGILRWKVNMSNKVRKGDIAGTIDSNGYVIIKIYEKPYKAHRLIWLGVKGYLPENLIDHKDRIRHHNWFDNLRETSKTCNAQNSGNRKDNKSGIKGVSHSNNKWLVRIRSHGKENHIGVFDDFDEAVCHRLAAEQCIGWGSCDDNSPAYQYIMER